MRRGTVAGLEALAQKWGNICLRRYGSVTLLGDTQPGRELGYQCSGPYVRVGLDPLWTVSVHRGQILAVGRSAAEAIRKAYRVKRPMRKISAKAE
jgi:hypothetical protein